MQNLAYKTDILMDEEASGTSSSDPPDGTHLGTIDLGAPTGNIAWGEDGSSLFITSNRNLYRLKLTTKGAEF
jgi:sugar lactone lactonase YvrE